MRETQGTVPLGRISSGAGGFMGLADELKALQELYEQGKLTDQEYADAKAAVIRGQASTPTQASEAGGGEQAQERKSPGCLTIFAVIGGAFVILIMILFHSASKTPPNSGGSSPSSPASDANPVQRPAVLVDMGSSSGNPEEDLGARDYLHSTIKNSLPGVVTGLNAICSEFHFYSDVSKPDYTMVFVVRDINQIGVGVWVGVEGKQIGIKKATSIQSAYFTACGLLRKHVSGPPKR
jgi:hypothetical protein